MNNNGESYSIKVIDATSKGIRSVFIPVRKYDGQDVVKLGDVAEYFPGVCGLNVAVGDKSTKLAQQAIYAGEPHLNNLNFYLSAPPGGWKSKSEYVVSYELVHPTPVGLALSGGGFRATLFHLGALQRLNELGVLPRVDTIASVSGGSIINALLATHWNDLKHHQFSEEAFDVLIRRPVHKFVEYNFASRILFHPKEVFKRLWNFKSMTTATLLAEAYTRAEREVKESVKSELKVEFEKKKDLLSAEEAEKYQHLLSSLDRKAFDLRLSEALPDPNGMKNPPLFIFCGCDMRSGGSIYFTKPRVSQDLYAPTTPTEEHRYNIPESEATRLAGDLTLAQAVAASSAHPFFAEPLQIFYQTTKVLPVTDGGVVDNTGMEPLLIPNMYKKMAQNDVPLPHIHMYISNAGAPVEEVDYPNTNIVSRLLRVLDLIGVQAERLRGRLMKENIKSKKIYGAFWGLDDLWRYYYALKLAERSARNTTGSSEVDPVLSVQEGTTLKSTERSASKEALAEFLISPDSNFKRFEEIFKPMQSAEWRAAKELIHLVTSFRTDLNYINPNERNMVEAMGYMICAYNVKHYAAPAMTRRNLKDVNMNLKFDPHNRYSQFLNAPKIRSAFNHSQSVFKSFVRNSWSRLFSWSKQSESTSDVGK